MPTFEIWNVVKVPFPYADRPVRQRRPALVVAAEDLQASHSLLWVLMITSAENRGWPSDVPVGDLETAGLPAPSVVRTTKVAVIDSHDAELLGSLAAGDRGAVSRQVGHHLAGMLKASRDA